MNEGQKQEVNRPMAIWVFGVLNIVYGCYFLVRMGFGWGKMIVEMYKKTGTIIGIGVLDILLLAFNLGLIIWLIALGYGLLTMKRWARRGSVLYGWIQIVFIVFALAAMVIGLSRMTLFEGWWETFLTVDDALILIQWLYMILLLVFMRSNKVKEAFRSIEKSPLDLSGELLGNE